MPAVAKQAQQKTPTKSKALRWSTKRGAGSPKSRVLALVKKSYSSRAQKKPSLRMVKKIEFNISPEHAEWQNSLVEAGAKLLAE